MYSHRNLLCSECGAEVVDSNSERGYKFCPECVTTKGRRDVEVEYIRCECCDEELDQSERAQAAREREYEKRVEEEAEKDDYDPDSLGEGMLAMHTYQAFKASISPDSMCENCLKAGCSVQIEPCSYRKQTTDPSECDHSFFPVVYGQHDEECRWCGLERGGS